MYIIFYKSHLICVVLTLIFSPARPHIQTLRTSVGTGAGPHAILPGADLELDCEFSGVPEPVLRWYWNGEVMEEERESGNRSGLVILEGSRPLSGVYQCHLANQYGVSISSTVLCLQSET